MTRFVLIGDSHFGPGERNADRYRALDQIVTFGRDHLAGLGAWLHAGDLNHAKMTIEDRNALAQRFQAMAEVAPVLIVAGNHDVAGDLDIFSRLAARHPITVVTSPQVLRLQLATGETAAVFACPYVHRAGLVTGGVMHADLGQTARAQLEPVFMAAAADLDGARTNGELPIFLAHINVGGSISSTGQPQIGTEIELDPALLARLGDVPKILGHIHKHQEVAGAWYLGSIARMDFGEQEDKVFGVLNYESPTIWALDFLPIETPRQIHIEGQLTREAFTIYTVDDEPFIGPLASGWNGADVRVRYMFNKAEISALDVAKIHAEFAGCRSLVLDPVAVLEHQVRAPEIVAAATLEEKVQAYGHRHGIAWSDGLARKVAALQKQDGADILTTLATILPRMGEAEPLAAAEAPAGQPAEQAVA